MIKNIHEYIRPETIELNLKSKNKNGVIKEIFEKIKNLPEVTDSELSYSNLLEREEMGSTGIGEFVAIPHAKTEGVSSLVINIGILKDGIEYNSIDEKPAKIFIMFLAPKNRSEEYLIILARISRLIKNENFTKKLLEAKTQEEIINIIKEEESI